MRAQKTIIKTKKFPLDTILSLIIITSNDENIIENRLLAIHKTLTQLKTNYEILVIDNNSSDKTVERIRTLHRKIPYTRILILSKEYETEIALTAGLDNCVGDYAILFNIYTDPPETISLLVDKLLDSYDIVTSKCKRNLFEHGFLSKLFLSLVEKLSTRGFYYHQNYLMGLNRKVINSIIRVKRKSRNFNYINYLIGFRKSSIEYEPLRKLLKKIKKENFFDLVITTMDILISNSFRPIRILSFSGMIASASFIFYIFIVVIIEVVFKKIIAPQGWISTATVMGAMFFLLFSLLTIISEYVIRILSETRNEPIYFVSEEIDKSVILPKKKRLNII